MKSNAPAGGFTVRIKPVVLVSVPAFPVRAMVKFPVGVAPVVVIVIVVEQEVDGVQEVGEKAAVTPAGSPVTSEGEKETAWAVPDILLTVIVFETELP